MQLLYTLNQGTIRILTVISLNIRLHTLYLQVTHKWTFKHVHMRLRYDSIQFCLNKITVSGYKLEGWGSTGIWRLQLTQEWPIPSRGCTKIPHGRCEGWGQWSHLLPPPDHCRAGRHLESEWGTTTPAPRNDQRSPRLAAQDMHHHQSQGWPPHVVSYPLFKYNLLWIIFYHISLILTFS